VGLYDHRSDLGIGADAAPHVPRPLWTGLPSYSMTYSVTRSSPPQRSGRSLPRTGEQAVTL
jgi:hypothetical protein